MSWIGFGSFLYFVWEWVFVCMYFVDIVGRSLFFWLWVSGVCGVFEVFSRGW